MVLRNLFDGSRNRWANMRVETLVVDQGFTFNGNGGVFDISNITPGAEDQIIRVVGGVLTYQDQLVNSNLPDNITVDNLTVNSNAVANNLDVTNNITADDIQATTSLSGPLAPSNIIAGSEDQIIRVVGGVSTYQDEIVTSNIPDQGVTEDKLEDFSVSEEKLQNSSVTEDKILDGSVSTAKIENDAVTSIKILDNNVTPAKISEGADGQVLTTVGTDVLWRPRLRSTELFQNTPQVINSTASIPWQGLTFNGLGLGTLGATINAFPAGSTYNIIFNANYEGLAAGDSITLSLRSSAVNVKSIVLSNTGGTGTYGGDITIQKALVNPSEIDIRAAPVTGSVTFNNITIFIQEVSR